MNDSNIWVILVTTLFGSGGIIIMAMKFGFEYFTKRLEHIQTKEIKNLEEPLRLTLQGIDKQNDTLHRLHELTKANSVNLIRLSNGEVFADKTHKWSFTATLTVGDDSIRQSLQNRSVFEAPYMFSELEHNGKYFCTDTLTANDVLANRLSLMGVDSYCAVATHNCMNLIIITWNKPIEVSDTLLEIIKSDLYSIEPFIK